MCRCELRESDPSLHSRCRPSGSRCPCPYSSRVSSSWAWGFCIRWKRQRSWCRAHQGLRHRSVLYARDTSVRRVSKPCPCILSSFLVCSRLWTYLARSTGSLPPKAGMAGNLIARRAGARSSCHVAVVAVSVASRWRSRVARAHGSDRTLVGHVQPARRRNSPNN